MTEPDPTFATHLAGQAPGTAPGAAGWPPPAWGGYTAAGYTAADLAGLKAGILALAPQIDAVEWGSAGTALHSYQCGNCYRASLTAAAPSLPMACPPRTPPPPGTRCGTCGAPLE